MLWFAMRHDACAGQAAFARGLLLPEQPTPTGVTADSRAGTDRRYDIHRNNVVAGLVDALAKGFPVCRRLVGEAFFEVMARDFVRQSPPRSPVLAEYGEAFAAFVEAFPPAAALPYLADVARLEFAAGQAYHAADAVPQSITALNGVPQSRWAGLRFAMHPAVRLVTSRYPVASIWRTNTFDREVVEIDAGVAEDAFVTRPELQVEVRTMQPGGAAFLRALMLSEPLCRAAEAGTDADVRFELTENLRASFAAGAIVEIL